MKKRKVLIILVGILVVIGISITFASSNNLQGLIFNVNQKQIFARDISARNNNIQFIFSTTDPTLPLENYNSLTAVKTELIAIKAKYKSTNADINGYEILKKLMNEQKYNPTSKNSDKTILINNFFDQYSLPSPGDRLFIINVATGLYAEANAKLPWSIRDLTQDQVKSLFIQNDGINQNIDWTNIGRPPYPNLPNVELQESLPEPSQVIEDSHFKQYRLALNITKGAKTEREAAEDLVIWAEKNFFHAYDETISGGDRFGWERYLDGRTISGDPSYDNSFPLSIDRIYDERIIGCQQIVFLLEGMFHNLKIPAVRIAVFGHAVLYLPTLNVFVHGDNIVSNKYPKGILLLTPEQFKPLTEAEGNMYKMNLVQYPIYLGLIRKDIGASKYLLISMGVFNIYPPTAEGKCISVTDSQWQEMTRDFAEFGLYYDKETCRVESQNKQILKTLEQLNN